MSEIRMEIRHRAELTAPLVTRDAGTILQTGDRGANVVVAEVLHQNAAADLSGCTAEGVMLKMNGSRIQMDGTISGNSARVVLADECYSTAGPYIFSVRLKNAEGVKRTVLRMAGVIVQGGDEWDD